MKLRVAAMIAGVLVLAACGAAGGGKAPDNRQLAAQVLEKLGAKSTVLVCWTQPGYLSGAFHHAYNRECGPKRGLGSIYIVVDAKKGTWCVVTPRYVKLPLCPGVAGD